MLTEIYRRSRNVIILERRILTAGGSGHLPVFLGYVGSGLLDGCAVAGKLVFEAIEGYLAGR